MISNQRYFSSPSQPNLISNMSDEASNSSTDLAYNRELIKSKKIGSEIIRNLELQMALYFNAVLFPFWLVMIVFMLYHKYSSLHDLYQILTTIIIIILIPTEGFRLYLGFVGNLLEKIPELAGFWMLSLMLQFPLQLFVMLSKGISSSAAEKSVQFVMCTMLILELVFGFIALKRISEHRANNFHLLQLRSKAIPLEASASRNSKTE